MGYITGFGRAFVGVIRLGGVIVHFGFTKKAAVRKFEQALLEEGLPQNVASRLAEEYSDMVILNPLAYTRKVRFRRRVST